MMNKKSQTKYYLKTNKNNNPLQKSQKNKNKNAKKKTVFQLEEDIHEMTKKIEQEKINLHLLKERMEQRKKTLTKLQGKPITNLSLEEKEKNRLIRRKEINNSKYYDPIKRKIGKEREIIDAKKKMEKQKEKNENEFEKLGEDIDILIENNKILKKDIQNLRKQKMELEKVKEKIIKENKIKENKLNDKLRNNNIMEKEIKNIGYKKYVIKGIEQEKDFSTKRDELEIEYQKVVKEYIKKEKEFLKEKEYKNQIEELKKKGNMKEKDKMKNKELLKELKKIEDEEINDRTPILDELLEKWRTVNKQKKNNVDNYINNCTKIRDALENLAIYLDLTSISYLPEIFQKTEQKLSNINFQVERLENEGVQLDNEKNTLINQIELLNAKKKGITAYRHKFLQQKMEKFKIIENLTAKLNKNIAIMENFFKRIQPETDNFLQKFNESFLSEYIINKVDIDVNKTYNYKTINNYLSNVEDYLYLIQDLNSNDKIDNYDMIEKQNLDELREDMKEKLEGFEAKRIMNKSLYNSMNIERKKGQKLNDIIIKTSSNIINDKMKTPQNNINNRSKYNKSNYFSREITEDENCRYNTNTNNNDSQAYQQSSIYYPVNSSRVNNK